jgi:hypothetical protein
MDIAAISLLASLVMIVTFGVCPALGRIGDELKRSREQREAQARLEARKL